jgi:D-sedoheptulose 7-phosphate isomerase
MNPLLQTLCEQHRQAVDGFFAECHARLGAVADEAVRSLRAGGKLLFCGNGGSACDAMHIAGELVGRFVNDRKALPAIALSADTGIITAIANDYSYDTIFSRQVEALGNPGDVLLALSTSGQSRNVLEALATARARGLKTVLMTGKKGEKQSDKADFLLVVPSLVTAHIQEAHITGLHALASLIEFELFANKSPIG